jgi:hypothetical protein
MKTAHNPAEMFKGVIGFGAVLAFFVVVIHQLTKLLG